MPSSSPALALTEAARVAQARRATTIAALVAYYYRTQVQIDDPSTVLRWLDLLVPRILSERRATARLAATYGNALRQIELGSSRKPDDIFRFTEVGDLDEAVVRTSLNVVGVKELSGQVAKIKRLEQPPEIERALVKKAQESAVVRVTGSAARHVANGGRQTLLEGVKADPVALGYVRVTKAKPCYFCAMLASRGLVYTDDSFDASDPRFTGEGTVKVHDSCMCSLKPAYDREDEILEQSKAWSAMWSQAARGNDPVLEFRKLYEGRD